MSSRLAIFALGSGRTALSPTRANLSRRHPEVGNVAIPSTRPGGRIRSLAVGLLLAVAALLVVPAAGAAPRGGRRRRGRDGRPADPVPRRPGRRRLPGRLGPLTVNVLGARAAAQVRAAGATRGW